MTRIEGQPLPLQEETQQPEDFGERLDRLLEIPEPHASLIRAQEEMRKRLPEADRHIMINV